MLFPYKKQGAVWGPLPWDSDQHPGWQAGQPCLPLPYIPPGSCTALHPSLPAWLLFCMSGLSLGSSALFNCSASDGSDFSLLSWQPSRTHPSFSFSQRRFGAARAEDQPKAAHWRAGMREEASSSFQEQPSTEAGHQSRKDGRTDINRASPALQEKEEEITEASEIRKRKKHRNLQKEKGFNFSRYVQGLLWG